MLTALLFGIFVALVIIARELYLFRAERHRRRSRSATREYRPRVFTFERTPWGEITQRWAAAAGCVVGMVAWWEWAWPLLSGRLSLPEQSWIWLALNLSGLLIFACLAGVLAMTAAMTGMEAYDERVFQRVLTAQEREHLKLIFDCDSVEQFAAAQNAEEEIFREKGL